MMRLTWSLPLSIAGVFVGSRRPIVAISSFPSLLVAFHAGGGSLRPADLQTLLLGGEVVLVALAAVEGKGLAGVRLRVVVPPGEHSAAGASLVEKID